MMNASRSLSEHASKALLADYAVPAIGGVAPPDIIEDGPVADARRRLGLAPDEPVVLSTGNR